MPAKPAVNIQIGITTKNFNEATNRVNRLIQSFGQATTAVKTMNREISQQFRVTQRVLTSVNKSIDKQSAQSMTQFKRSLESAIKTINKTVNTLSSQTTRLANHTVKQLSKITSAGITSTSRLAAATERNLSKVSKAYDGALRSAKTADASIAASAKQIKKNAEDMMKGTTKFGQKLSSALTTIETKLDQVLKGIQAMSRSAASAARNATRAVQAHEKALQNSGKTARSEIQAQTRMYQQYSTAVQRLFVPPDYNQRSFSNLIRQRRQFNLLMRQTAQAGGIPQGYEPKGKMGAGEKLPQLPIGKLDDSSLRQWSRGEQIVFNSAMSRADMLRLKWGQLSIPLDALSRRLLETGRMTSQLGRNLTMTFTAPLVLAFRRTTQLYLSIAQEYARIQKVAGIDTTSKNAAKAASSLKVMQGIKQDIATGVGRYGISGKTQAALMGDIIAMGYEAKKTGKSINGMTTEAGQMADEIMRTATLGDIGIKTATDFYRTMLKVFVSAQPGVKTFSDTIEGTNFIVDQLNQIENKTSINLNQLADAMPIAAGAAKLFGMKAAELASILTGLYDKGIAVNTAATGINFSMTRILAPTKKASVVFDQAFGQGSLRQVQNIGGGMERLITLSEMYRKLLETQGKVKVTQVFSELVSKRQIKTFEPLVSSINEGTDQVRNALLAIPEAVKMASDKNIDIGNRDTPFYDLVPLMTKFKKELLTGAAGAEAVTNGYIRALIAANGWATTTTDNVKELAKELAKMSTTEIAIKLKSDPVRYQILLQTIKLLGAQIGEFLFPIVLRITNVVKKFVEGLNNLTPSAKALISAFFVSLAAIGPLAMALGSFRTVLGFATKAAGLFLPKLKTMSLDALLLAQNMGLIDLKTQSVLKVGKDMAVVMENSQSKLSRIFMRLRGVKMQDIAITETMIEQERRLAAAKGETLTASELESRALEKETLRKTLGVSGRRDPLGKSPIARRILGRGGGRGVMPKGFVPYVDEFQQVRDRYAGIAAQAAQVPTGETPEAVLRRQLVGELGQTIGVTPTQTEKFPTKGTHRITRELMTPEQRAAEDAAIKNLSRKKRKRSRLTGRLRPVSAISEQEFAKRAAEVKRTGQNLPLPDYLYKQQVLRNTEIADMLSSAQGTQGLRAGSIAKLAQVEEAARMGDLGPLEAYAKTTKSAKIQGLLGPIAARAATPIDVGIPQGVEPRGTIGQRFKQRIFSRKSATTKSAKALVENIASGAEVGTTAAMGGPAAGAMENAIKKEITQRTFKDMRKVYARGIGEVIATPFTTALKPITTPLKALAFSKVEEEGKKIRGRGLANLRPVRAYQALFGKGGDILDEEGNVIGSKRRGRIPRALDRAKGVRQFIKDRGGIKGALTDENVTERFKQLKTGATGALKLFSQFGIYTPIIIAIGVAIFLIAKNWDKVYKAMAPGVKAIKEAWNKLLDAFKGVGKIFGNTFKGLAGESKKGEKSITSPFQAVGEVLSSLLELVSAIVEGIAGLINKLAPVFRWLATIMYNSFGFLINLIKGLAKLFKGDLSGAVGYFKIALGYLFKYILSIIRPITMVFTLIGKAILKTVGFILGGLSKLPFVGKMLGKARDAVNNFAKNFDIERILNKGIDAAFMKDRELAVTGVAGEQVYQSKKRRTENKQQKEKDLSGSEDDAKTATKGAADKMANIWDNFLSTLKSKLDETINELKETLNKSFAKVWEERLKVYDDQIKAIDELEKKEEELLATQEYLQNRREALNKRALDRENYRRNRALAIYEGRIDDARMLDLEFSQTDQSNNKSITDLDTSRARSLLKQQRDIQRQRIQEAKAAAEEWMKVEEDNFKKQIDLITQYTPRTDTEWRNMMDTINNTIANYGMPAITGSFMDGMAVFQQASNNAKNDIIASSFWSGEWIDTSILSWISQMSGIPLQNLVKTAEAAGSAIAGGFQDGLDGEDNKDEPKDEPWAKKAQEIKDTIDLFRRTQAVTTDPQKRQELANAFQGWGPSISPTTPALTRPMTRAERRAQETGGLLGGRNATIGPLPSNTNVTTTGTTIPGRKKNTPKKDIDNEGYWAGVGRRGGEMIRGFGSALSFVSHMFGPPKDQKEGTNKAVGNLMKSISNSIKSFGKELFKQDGADITRGINSGILDPRTQAEAKRSGVKTVDNIRDAARDHAKIKSPSRLFADEVGKPIIYGIIAGILDNKAVARLRESFENLLKPLLNVERKGKIYIDFDVTTGGIRSGIEQRLNEIFGKEIKFKTPQFLIDIQKIFKAITAGARAYVKMMDIGVGQPNNGPNMKVLEAYLGSPIPGFAKGGIVKSRPGGIVANVGEGRYDEAIIPLPNGLKNFANSFHPAATSMGSFEGSMKAAMVSALRECAPYMGSEESGSVNIYVDNFIGQPQWFESMMTEYGVKVAPNKQRSYGTMNRRVSSYQDNSYRTGKI